MLASVDFSSLLLSLGTATDESLCSPVDLPLFMYGCVMITRLRDATPSASDPRFFFFFFSISIWRVMMTFSCTDGTCMLYRVDIVIYAIQLTTG